MKVDEAIYMVLEAMNISSDDSDIPDQLVYQCLKDARSELLSQEANKSRMWDTSYTQTIDRLPFCYTDLSACPELPSGVMLHKSKFKVPTGISTNNGEMITGLYTLSGESITIKRSLDDVVNMFRTRYAKKEKTAFRRDGYIFIVAHENPETFYGVIEGIFHDPELIDVLNKCCEKADDLLDEECGSVYDNDFPLPGNIDRRVFILAGQMVGLRLGIPTDTTNNALSEQQIQQRPR